MTRTETQVSKAHPAIKRLITATEEYGAVPWRGRNVSVAQADPRFAFHLYNDTGEPRVYSASVVTPRVSRIPRPPYGGPATVMGQPSGGEVVVVRQIGPTGSITIYVPEVARDALIAGDKPRATAVLKDLGPYAGIGAAILESQDKTLAKVSSGKKSRRLDREIAEILRGRKI